MCKRFDRVVCMTEEDLETLKRFVDPRKLRAVPIGVDCKYYSRGEALERASGPPRTLFVGNYRHTPNQEAVYFFAERILPRIHSVLPDTIFDVVGGNVHLLDSRRLRLSGRVNLVGQVEDVRSYYRRADVFVAPLLSGNGMRVKILEACAMGMAIVASALAVQGFARVQPSSFRVADSPEQFVTATLGLLQDVGSRRELGTKARQMIAEHYDWDVLESKVLDLVEARDV